MSLPTEETPLLSNPPAPPSPTLQSQAEIAAKHDGDGDASEDNVCPQIKKRLYISHFLSIWNSRVFEFGAALYLAGIFANTLLPMSIYALIRGASAIFLAPLVGRYIDIADRLKVIRISIVSQRLAVAISCVGFWVLAKGCPMEDAVKYVLYGVLAVLACVEKLAAIMCVVSIEKDWVVVIAQRNEASLRNLNAQMRRIDLGCRLAGPLFISTVAGFSIRSAILLNLVMNLLSVVIEYSAIAKVYTLIPPLQEPKSRSDPELPTQQQQTNTSPFRRIQKSTQRLFHDLNFYFTHPAFLPSFAGALLYLTVLNFAGQMVTYLLATGYSTSQIGLARTGSVLFELSTTFIAPRIMKSIGPIRAGIWFINFQILALALGVSSFWLLSATSPLLGAAGLIAGTMLSRVGLRGVDFCVQIIVQEDVEASHRGTFSSIEASFQNLFEVCSYASTIVFYRPQDFGYPAAISACAVFSAGVAYSAFARRRRGHLLHLPSCISTQERKKRSVSVV